MTFGTTPTQVLSQRDQSKRDQSKGHQFRRDCGASRITLIIFSALALFVGFVFYETLPKFYRFYELENQAFGMARRAGIVTDKEIRKRLLREIRAYDIPADPEELEILRDDGNIEINISYEDTLYLPWYNRDIELHTFEFHLYVKESYSSRKQKY